MKLAFLIIVFGVTLFNFCLCIKSLVYNKLLFWYHSRKYRDDYTPKVSIFVPCKGADNNLKNHLEAIARQDYPDFKVRFIVDNIADSAVEEIEYVTTKYPHNTKLLVSGKAKKCGQKNHNLLYGIEDDGGESEVYVFADSDVEPHPTWLRELIRPLSLPSVPVTTGFRWLIPEDYSLSGAIHSMMSAYLCILISHQLFRGVWGGSTAIKREVFEKLGVKELWKNVVVDDMTLTKLLFRKRINRVFVPTCLTVSYNTLTRLQDDITWYSRQAAFLKTYIKPLWIASLYIHFITTALLVVSPLYVLLSFFYGTYLDYAIISVCCSQINMLSYAMMKFIYRDNQRFIHWFLFAPLMQILGFYSLIKPGFSRNIKWRNICYELYRDGSVKSINEIASAQVEIV